jgi:hypothetical protein
LAPGNFLLQVLLHFLLIWVGTRAVKSQGKNISTFSGTVGRVYQSDQFTFVHTYIHTKVFIHRHRYIPIDRLQIMQKLVLCPFVDTQITDRQNVDIQIVHT